MQPENNHAINWADLQVQLKPLTYNDIEQLLRTLNGDIAKHDYAALMRDDYDVTMRFDGLLTLAVMKNGREIGTQVMGVEKACEIRDRLTDAISKHIAHEAEREKAKWSLSPSK